MSSKQSETPRRGVGTDIGGGKWTISNTTKGTTGCNCAVFASTFKTPICGKHWRRRASGKIQTLGAFTGTASSTTWQMEKMRRAFSPLYESLLPPPALRERRRRRLARCRGSELCVGVNERFDSLFYVELLKHGVSVIRILDHF